MKGFTDDEREYIRRQLRETGRELFARYGLEKTTIADLTEPADIANSTFYQFFDSKELLYLDIMLEEGREATERIVANSLEAEDDPEAALRAFMHLILEEVETNPLVHRLVVEDELPRLMASIPDEELEARQAESFAVVTPYIEEWQAAGEVRAGDPRVVTWVVGVVKLLAFHREDAGELYPEVKELLVDVIAAGLTATDD